MQCIEMPPCHEPCHAVVLLVAPLRFASAVVPCTQSTDTQVCPDRYRTACSLAYLQTASFCSQLQPLEMLSKLLSVKDCWHVGVTTRPASFHRFLKGFSKCHKVVIDCTANAQVPSYYSTWLSSGIHVITPNKKLCSGPLNDWTRVREAAKENGTQFMYEVRPDYTALHLTALHHERWMHQFI